MAKPITLETLISDVRLYADQRAEAAPVDPADDDRFVTDVEIARVLNHHLADSYDLLLSAAEQGFYDEEATIALGAGLGVSGSSTLFALPDDFYRLRSITLEWGADRFELLEPINSTKGRKRFQNQGSNVWSEYAFKGYRLRKGNLEVLPTVTSSVTARLIYIPTFKDLVFAADEDLPDFPNTFDGVNGWERLAVLGAAIDILNIEQQGAGDILRKDYSDARERIEQAALDRANDDPIQIEDVEAHHDSHWLDFVPSGSAV